MNQDIEQVTTYLRKITEKSLKEGKGSFTEEELELTIETLNYLIDVFEDARNSYINELFMRGVEKDISFKKELEILS